MNNALIQFFEKIKGGKIKVFENINNKEQLFDLFVIINIKTFQRSYFTETFSSILKNNEALIKKHIGSKTNYNKLLEIKDDKKANIQKDELFNLIKKDINMSTDKIYIIIASFYYLFYYKFVDVKEIKGRTNIGNVYINFILKNFVLFLAENCDKMNDLIDLLYQLQSYDFNNLISISKEYANKNKTYSFSNIESEMNEKCSKNMKIIISKDSKDYSNAINDEDLFNKISSHIYHQFSFQNFKLIAAEEKIYSNIITFIIDIFPKNDEDRNKEWKNFMDYFDKKTMFYFYQWSGFYKEDLIQKKDDEIYPKMLIKMKTLSKFAGKILADILICNKFFNNYIINLVGVGFGANVAKYCIKQLSALNGSKNFVKMKNVILIGGATHIKHEDKWIANIDKAIIDRFINCYSTKDDNLKGIYSAISTKFNKLKKNPIGVQSLEIRNNKDSNNLVTNFDFSNENSCEPEKVVEKIFAKFKDI